MDDAGLRWNIKILALAYYWTDVSRLYLEESNNYFPKIGKLDSKL